MEHTRGYTRTSSRFQSAFEPERVWEYLVHPKHSVGFTKKPCHHNEIPEGFALDKRRFWTEIHTGEDCSGDIVRCEITEVVEPVSFTTVRHQAGIRNTSRYTLEANAEGTLICEEQRFGPSVRQFTPLAMVSWALLLSGLLARLASEPENDRFWFENMERAIADSMV